MPFYIPARSTSYETTSWFHCGRCNSLFQSQAEEVDGSFFCTACGYGPSLGSAHTSGNATASQSGTQIPTDNNRQSNNRQKTWFRQGSAPYFYAKLVTGWLLVTVLLIYMIRWICNDGLRSPVPQMREAPATKADSEENSNFLNRVGPLCNLTFSNFLSAETSEARCQLVHQPTATAALMASFYRMNPLEKIDRRMLRLEKMSVLHTPVGRAIESYWKTSDGRHLDAVFLEDGGEWRLDWDHYAKFSDSPWPLFLAGEGEARGEFRLLARERLATERENTPFLGLSFYGPRFGHPDDLGIQSSEFLVERTSPNGKQLAAAFALEKSGKRVFSATLPNIYPEGLIPIRVKIHRFEENAERRFEIEEIVACHWYSINATGVDISDLSETRPSQGREADEPSTRNRL